MLIWRQPSTTNHLICFHVKSSCDCCWRDFTWAGAKNKRWTYSAVFLSCQNIHLKCHTKQSFDLIEWDIIAKTQGKGKLLYSKYYFEINQSVCRKHFENFAIFFHLNRVGVPSRNFIQMKKLHHNSWFIWNLKKIKIWAFASSVDTNVSKNIVRKCGKFLFVYFKEYFSFITT